MCTKKNVEIKCKEAEVTPLYGVFRVYVREYIASEILDTLSYCQRRVQQESTISRITHSATRLEAAKLHSGALQLMANENAGRFSGCSECLLLQRGLSHQLITVIELIAKSREAENKTFNLEKLDSLCPLRPE